MRSKLFKTICRKSTWRSRCQTLPAWSATVAATTFTGARSWWRSISLHYSAEISFTHYTAPCNLQLCINMFFNISLQRSIYQ